MRDTTKWLLTLIAALGSVLLAGLRFGDAARLQVGSKAFYVATAAALIALTAVAIAIAMSCKVLAGRYNSLIAVLQAAEKSEERKPGLPADMTSDMIKAISLEKDYLLRGTAQNLASLFQQIRKVDEDLLKSRQPDSGTTPYERAELRTSRRELEDAAERVIDFADHWVTTQRFVRLQVALLIGGFVTAGSVLTFALVVNRPHVEVKDRPIAVQVFLTPKGQTWAKAALHCKISLLDGFAVAGSLEDPEVVTPEVVTPELAGCSAARFVVTSDLGVVVPK